MPHHQPPQLSLSSFPNSILTVFSLLLFITTPTRHHLNPRAAISPHAPKLRTRHHITPRAIILPHAPNRHTRPLISSLPMSSPNRISRQFATPQSLSDWLRTRIESDSFSTWGSKPGTKNVHNLFLELEHGEVSLTNETPPVRTLQVVCANIYNNDGTKILIESGQELSDGSVRVRNRPLSEKLKSGEGVESGVRRAIREELGSVIEEGKFDEVVKVKMESYVRNVEEKDSVSYPGLPGCYVLHNVDVVVDGLPDGEFVSEEGCEYEGCESGVVDVAVSVKKHFWKWVDPGFV